MCAQQLLTCMLGFRLVTADLVRLTHFYCDVLGFATEGTIRSIDGAEMALLGLSGRGRRQLLSIGERQIALDEFDLPGRPYPAGSDAASLCFQHLALVVNDIARACARLCDVAPISIRGPQHLPPQSGGVRAFKFRDPDGHPLELLQFARGDVPANWRTRVALPGQIALGIDHSAISVSDRDASTDYYAAVGLQPWKRTRNKGRTQDRLDGLAGVDVDVVPMIPRVRTPHLELLAYTSPHPRPGVASRPNDVAATRIVWQGHVTALLSDPDGHLHQVEVHQTAEILTPAASTELRP